MVDNQPELIEETVSRVEDTADEAIQAAMVKTAIRANLAGESAEQTASLTDVAEERARREKDRRNPLSYPDDPQRR